MTFWAYQVAMMDLCRTPGVKVLVKYKGETYWGRCIDAYKIDKVYLEVDLDLLLSYQIFTLEDVIKYSKDGEIFFFPRHEDSGQTKLFNL